MKPEQAVGKRFRVLPHNNTWAGEIVVVVQSQKQDNFGWDVYAVLQHIYKPGVHTIIPYMPHRHPALPFNLEKDLELI